MVLCGLDEETAFVKYDVDCDANIILSYEWLRAHDLAFLYESDAACLCAERGFTSGRRVRLDLMLDVAPSPATRLSPAEARTLLSIFGSAQSQRSAALLSDAPPDGAHHCGRVCRCGLGSMG